LIGGVAQNMPIVRHIAIGRRDADLRSAPGGVKLLIAYGLTRISSMLLLIDNYDSFTWNLVHYFGELGADALVRRNDEIGVSDVLSMNPEAIMLSPGPCDPDKAGICLDLVRSCGSRIPILGVCLGHQAIAQAYGAKIVRAPSPMHGKLSRIRHTGVGVFRDIPDAFEATRYHSLTIDPKSVPPSLTVTATTDDGVIMGIAHNTHPVHGVQFHPESIASQNGHALLRNFLALARAPVAA
jgi:anthranilate synthase component 2